MIFMPYIDILITFVCTGFIPVMLPVHMVDTIDASQIEIAMAFLISGLVNLLASILTGFVSSTDNIAL